jgi:hypothetical protein
MPTLPPGSANVVNATPVAAVAFVPNPSATATVRFANLGNGTMYVGGIGVTPFNGLPVPPGNRPVELQNISGTLYTCCGVNSVASTGTLSAANAAGATSWTVATAAPTVSTYIRVGNGNSAEYLYVTAVTGAVTPWTATTSTASIYDHASGATVATVVSAQLGPISVQAGVL